MKIHKWWHYKFSNLHEIEKIATFQAQKFEKLHSNCDYKKKVSPTNCVQRPDSRLVKIAPGHRGIAAIMTLFIYFTKL